MHVVHKHNRIRNVVRGPAAQLAHTARPTQVEQLDGAGSGSRNRKSRLLRRAAVVALPHHTVYLYRIGWGRSRQLQTVSVCIVVNRNRKGGTGSRSGRRSGGCPHRQLSHVGDQLPAQDTFSDSTISNESNAKRLIRRERGRGGVITATRRRCSCGGHGTKRGSRRRH